MASGMDKLHGMLVIAGKPRGGGGAEEDEESPEYDETAAEAGSQELLDAIDAKDAKAIAKAFKALMDICDAD